MRLQLKLPATIDARVIARNSVEQAGADLPANRVDDLGLLVHELVVNSLRHAHLAPSDLIEVQVEQTDSGFRIEVADPGDGFATAERLPGTPPGPDQTRGMGLFFVDRLSDRWGMRSEAHRTCTRVWFEIDAPRFPA